MNKRLLGRSGLSVSALGLGTVELGMDYGLKIPDGYGRPSATDAIHIVHEALDNGVNLIDTARAYGESETIIGRALRGRRAQVVLATKVKTQSPDGTPLNGGALAEHMLDHLDASLKLLQTDYVDLWQIHQIDGTLLAQSDIVAAAFAQARAAGKVRAFGGSTYGAEMPLRALASDLFDVLQVGYSVLDQRLAAILPVLSNAEEAAFFEKWTRRHPWWWTIAPSQYFYEMARDCKHRNAGAVKHQLNILPSGRLRPGRMAASCDQSELARVVPFE